MRTISLFVGFLLACNSVWAGAQQGHITQLIVRASDGLIYFYLDGTASGRPACAVNPYWMLRDENSTAGKHQLALLIAAQATNKVISVTGMNSCARWADGEDVESINIPAN